MRFLKFFAVNIFTVCLLCIEIMSGNGLINHYVYAKTNVQCALWPMDVVYFTQTIGGDYSHAGTLNFDIVGEVKKADIKAPFDATVVDIYTGKNYGNTVVIQSNGDVRYADGTTEIMCMSFAHDNDISDIYIGKQLIQGEIFYQTGTYGWVTGDHSHVNCIRGGYDSRNFWKQNSYGNYCPNNAISPEKALFIVPSTRVIDSAGLDFKIADDVTISDSDTSTEVCPPDVSDVISGKVPVSSKDVTVSYDGVSHGIEIIDDSAFPTDTVITWSDKKNGQYKSKQITKKNAGTYTIYWKATNPHYTKEVSGSSKLKIKGLKLTAKVKGYRGEYDGEEHGITITDYPEGTKVFYRKSVWNKWSDEPITRKKVGSTTVFYKLENKNAKKSIYGSVSIVIKKKK